MPPLQFHIVDVFAEEKYTGNQLAVVRQAGELSGNEMQQITREMNYSETSFILSDDPSDDGYDVRIFTPEEEVPFAGHPTLGTAHVIRNEILEGKADQVILNLQVGSIPVTFSDDGYCRMRQIEPVFGAQHEHAVFADILGLATGDLDERYSVQEVSTGLPFFIVPLKTIAALQQCLVDNRKRETYVAGTEARDILVFCPETHEPDNDISVRVFVDSKGIPEDPATGSANGCLAGWLVRHRYFGGDHIDVRSEQGYEIDRPSLLLLQAERTNGGIQITVGGMCVDVARGELV